jgi:dipeptidyl aminopeptidase/acylaminoacyl peptidase
MEQVMSVIHQKRSFEPLDELRYALIGSARISPDGKWAVYERTQNDIEKEQIFTSLWRVNLETGETRRLTYGNKTDRWPEWSPDGKWIAFVSDRDGKQQIYLMPIDGGESRKLTTLKQGVNHRPIWSPDGRTIAFTAGPEADPLDPSMPYRVTRFVYRFDGIGNLDAAVQNIFIQVVSGGEAKQLTNDAHLNHSMSWSPDGREILYLAGNDPDRPELFSAKLRVVNLEGEVDEIIGLDSGYFIWNIRVLSWNSNGNWTPDGRKIIFTASTGSKPMGSKVDLWVVNREGGTPENRTKDFPYGVHYSAGKMLNAETTLVNVMSEGKIGIYSVSLTGEPRWKPLVNGERAASLQDSDGERLLFVSNTLENPSELHIANLDGSNERAVTQVNRQHVEAIAFPKVEHLLYKGEDGIQIEGWLLLPTLGKPPFPTILYIHGGPHGAYGYQYTTDFQMLAGAGYAVLFTNPRGSRGYGDAFSTALSGNWGVMDYKDLMAGVDYVIEKGFSDSDRLGVCGLSYGGFMTCFTVGQTNRFKAAVAENPITDLVSRYGTADMGPWGSLSELGGKPHEIPEIYRQSSPITYAHQCKTPTLLIQGEADYRCPIGQSEQFYSHLKANGCITEMVRLPDMPHVASINGPIIMQKTQNNELLGWMNKYVLRKM